MMSIRNLGYIAVYSSEPSNWQQYGTQVLGMEDVTGRYPGEHALLKMDALPWRIAVIKHDRDRFGFSGWETSDEAAFNKVVAQLQGAGVTVTIAGEDEMAQRRVQGLARFTDPSGNQHELYWGRISDYSRLVSPVGVRSFVTGAMGMGHVVLPATQFDATASLFIDTLGFGISDTMRIKFSDDPAEPVKRLWFLHCNPRHHSLALFEMDHPSGCIHAMVEVPNVDEVGRAHDRRIAHNVPLSATLGRHMNDDMISFYMKTPSGFDIEYGAEGLTVPDWSNHVVTESSVASIWGHDFSVGFTG